MLTFEAWPKEARSLRQQVTDSLRRAIVSQQLRPGQRLVEEEISQQMGISRGPIREALRQLEQEGLVFSFPYRGTVVAEIPELEVREVLMPIRLTLENFAIQHTLSRITKSEIKLLSAEVDKMRKAALAPDLPAIAECDLKFHSMLMTMSGQLHAAQLWHTIAPRILAHFYQETRQVHRPQAVAADHLDLLQAIMSRDVELVLKMLRPHIYSIPGSDPARSE